MAYVFSAEKFGSLNLKILHERISKFDLIEFFPVSVSKDRFVLGLSIPFKSMNNFEFEKQFEGAIGYLLSEQKFQVTDLFTGSMVKLNDIPGLVKRMRV